MKKQQELAEQQEGAGKTVKISKHAELQVIDHKQEEEKAKQEE